jgi:hypothetical protein
MKKLLLLSLVLIMGVSACKKTTAVAPANLDQNYDSNNRIFRLKASATMQYTVTITEIDPASPDVPYNSVHADQRADYDYGFVPVIGHIVKISIQSTAGTISATSYYKGLKIAALPVKMIDGGGSTSDYTYTVKD